MSKKNGLGKKTVAVGRKRRSPHGRTEKGYTLPDLVVDDRLDEIVLDIVVKHIELKPAPKTREAVAYRLKRLIGFAKMRRWSDFLRFADGQGFIAFLLRATKEEIGMRCLGDEYPAPSHTKRLDGHHMSKHSVDGFLSAARNLYIRLKDTPIVQVVCGTCDQENFIEAKPGRWECEHCNHRSLFDVTQWLSESKPLYPFRNPVADIKSPVPPRVRRTNTTTPLSFQGFLNILTQCDLLRPIGVFDHTLCEFLWFSLIRFDGVCHLNRGDFQVVNDDVVKVSFKNKGFGEDFPVEVFIPTFLFEMLGHAHKLIGSPWDHDDSTPAWPAFNTAGRKPRRDGNGHLVPISESALRKRLNRVLDKAGERGKKINKTFHRFRKGGAQWLHYTGVITDLTMMQKRLCHADLSTTMQYLDMGNRREDEIDLAKRLAEVRNGGTVTSEEEQRLCRMAVAIKRYFDGQPPVDGKKDLFQGVAFPGAERDSSDEEIVIKQQGMQQGLEAVDAQLRAKIILAARETSGSKKRTIEILKEWGVPQVGRDRFYRVLGRFGMKEEYEPGKRWSGPGRPKK
jgi:integrase